MNTKWLHRAMFYVACVCVSATAHAQLHPLQRGLTCSIYEQTMRVGIRDLPYQHEQIGLCLGNYIEPDEDGLIACRMFWRYVHAEDSHGVPTPRCEDHEFLSPTDEDVFGDKATSDGPTCLVRQVTQRQRERGETGWYYLSAAPQFGCRNADPAAIVPTQRPDYDWQIDLAWQCKAAMSIDVFREVAYQDDLSQCAQPKAAEVSDVGKVCAPELRLSDQGPTLEVGANECDSDLCLTRPLGRLFCEQESGGPAHCRSSDTVCTCRCAGDGPGPYCTCPDSFECKPLLTSYGATSELAGSYCVPPWPDLSTPSVPTLPQP